MPLVNSGFTQILARVAGQRRGQCQSALWPWQAGHHLIRRYVIGVQRPKFRRVVELRTQAGRVGVGFRPNALGQDAVMPIQFDMNLMHFA